MSQRLPNREQAIKLLKNNSCPQKVINHCLAVAGLALEITHKLRVKGLPIDLELVEAGALLHDIGRSKTHRVDHGIVGAQIALNLSLPEPLINVVKRHVGAGITDKEAELLGWPKDVYVPQTLEEKVVCYADKRIDNNKVTPIEGEIEKLQKRGFPEAAERVRNLHNEITELLGESP